MCGVSARCFQKLQFLPPTLQLLVIKGNDFVVTGSGCGQLFAGRAVFLAVYE